MAETNERVLQQIQDELRVRPDLSLGILYQFAVHIDPAIEGLKLRQFNMIYVVPAKQRLAAESRRSPRPRRKKRPAAGRASGRGAAPAATGPKPQPPRRAEQTPPNPGGEPVTPGAPALPAAPLAGAAAVARSGANGAGLDAIAAPAVPETRTAEAQHFAAVAEAGPGEMPADIATHRTKVRAALMSFALDLAAAEERAELVRVLTRVDGYIELLWA
jgi:hypothetical protein